MKRTWSMGSRTECQSPPPQSSEVCVGVFKGERSSDERDFFVAVRKSIVVVVDGSKWGSERGSASDMRCTCQRKCNAHILQFPERLTPRGIQTLPNSSMKYRPCGLMSPVQWWAYEVEEPGR
jgi:hypothetical protein